ncbi:MAG: hypothetical protein ACFFDN_48350 [Candidatus Hodarchaeota archaeon]
MEICEFSCPECGQKGVPFKVEHSPKRAIFIITLKCPKHKIKLKIQENKIKYYLDDIINSTLICPYCGNGGSKFKVEYNLLDTFAQPALSLLKLCTECGKKTPYVISNILYTQFYDTLFLLLNKKESSELIRKYRKAITCPKCNSDIIIKNVDLKNSMGYIVGRCSGLKQHKIEISVPLEEQYNWLIILPELINKCQYCNSKDLFSKELNFDVLETLTNFLTEKRILNQTCKNCGKNNITKLHHSFYEIYRRILGKKEHKKLDKTQLFCPKCNSEALLGSLQLKSAGLQLIQLCKKKHITKKILAQEEKPDWIDQVLSGVKFCKKCWSQNQRVRGFKFNYPRWGRSQIQHTQIKLQCLDCKKKRVIVINNLIFDELMDFLFND